MFEFSLLTACAPVFVPIDINNDINFKIIPKYSEYLLDNGVKSIFVNGGCGEFSSLTLSERKLLLEKWIEVSSTDTQVVVNIGTTNFADTVELGNHALLFKVYGLVIVPPYYMPVANEADLLAYIESVVHALSRLSPILYYHIPSLTKANIDLSTFVTLAYEHNFRHLAAIKFTDSNYDNLLGLVNTIKTLGSTIKVYCGYEPLLADAMELGVSGCILASVNITPRKIATVFDSVMPGSQGPIVASTKEMFAKIAAFSVENRVQIMGLLKMAAEANSGLALGPMRRPYEISEQHARSFKELLAMIGRKAIQ